jgi:hypothetical protein
MRQKIKKLDDRCYKSKRIKKCKLPNYVVESMIVSGSGRISAGVATSMVPVHTPTS